MSHLAPSPSSFQSTERIGQDTMSGESEQQSPYTTSIHILDDDSLLNVFHLYRPFPLSDELVNGPSYIFRAGAPWIGERWWFRLAHVCQRWRNIILGSASYLGICLACAQGTPVADMLAHSPPLPLVIDYKSIRDITAEDEVAAIFAIKQRDRVRRIRINLYSKSLQLQKLFMAIDGEYPILEYLILWDYSEDNRTVLILPETLQAPHLRYLSINCSIPIPFRLLATAVGLVTLFIKYQNSYIYFQPTILLQSLSLMPQLETLVVYFMFTIPDHDVERPDVTTHVTLPNLRSFKILAGSYYSEAILSRITASHLEEFKFGYFKQLTFSASELLRFMGRTENLRFYRTEFRFLSDRFFVCANSPETNIPIHSLFESIIVKCEHFYWPVSYVAQIFSVLSQISSAVEHLTLVHDAHWHSWPFKEHNEVDRTEWRNLLRLFRNVKTLRIEGGPVRDLSRYLPVEDGEHPLELLPELKELTYPDDSNANDVFSSLFIEARRDAGRPVTLIKS